MHNDGGEVVAGNKQCRPDFLIIGTMKGGTTVLYDFICDHPAVNQAVEKEIHYFSLYPFRGLDWYLGKFKFEEGKITGEASPTYFDTAFTQSIPSSIRSINPDMRLLLIVRDPIERAISHFYHYVKINKIEKLENMGVDDFFSIPVERAFSQVRDIDFYLYNVMSFSFYYRKYLTYLSVFSSDNILVLSSNDLKNSADEVMQKVYKFLKIEPFTSRSFQEFRYSTGSKQEPVKEKTIERLRNIFYRDYELFCGASGISFSPAY
jgi:hypothetical protein